MSETNPGRDIIVFTDGACSGNPGAGGWAAIIATPQGHVTELGGRDARTTNNQMELMGALAALDRLESQDGDVVVYTDSVYVIRGITQWIWGWIRNGWRTSDGTDVLNKDLWQALSMAVAKRKKRGGLAWKYVRGHRGVPGNERCDEIAVAFSKGIPVRLYDGSLLRYSVAIHDLPPDEPLPEMRNKKGEKTAAHSYLSLLGGTAMRHATWAECERRVKGQPGAKFKKAMAASDEAAILKSWGVDPKNVK